jgi:transcriptional regulator with PAS, ATPase and Fis domain
LQEHEFERAGGSRRIRADVRVIAATNRDLHAAISGGSFRSDLFYRLNVFLIELPSLRERREGIPLLVEYFIDRYARKAGKNIRGVNKRTLQLLQSYPWPGNMRELQNVIERSVIACETENFSVDESWLSQKPPERKAESQLYLSEKVATQEKEIIEAALRESQDGCSDRRVPPPNWVSRGPRWNRRFGHLRLTRIASGLSREPENSRLIFDHVVTPRATVKDMSTCTFHAA